MLEINILKDSNYLWVDIKGKLIIEEEGEHSGTNKKMFAPKNIDIMVDFILKEYQKNK